MRGRVVEEPAQHAAVQADRRPCKLYIRTQVHTGGGVMQDTQNRGAYLRMVDPLQPGAPRPCCSKWRRGRVSSCRSTACVVRWPWLWVAGCGAGWVRVLDLVRCCWLLDGLRPRACTCLSVPAVHVGLFFGHSINSRSVTLGLH